VIPVEHLGVEYVAQAQKDFLVGYNYSEQQITPPIIRLGPKV
jgi:hypothetical protein